MLDILKGTVSERTLELYNKSWAMYTRFCAEKNKAVWDAGSILAWRTSLVEARYGPNTINSHLSAIKSVFKAYMAAGDVSIETYTQVRAIASVSVRALRDRLRPSKDVLDDETVQRMIDNIDTRSLKGLRDKAIVAVLATTGIRIEELCTLTLAQCDAASKILWIRGKTDVRVRAVPLSSVALRAIWEWLVARDSASPYIFTSFSGRSVAIVDKPITTQGAHNAVVEAARAVGSNISAHDFRRYVATKLASNNIVEAQAVLGHASIVTTQRYVKRADLPSVDWLR